MAPGAHGDDTSIMPAAVSRLVPGGPLEEPARDRPAFHPGHISGAGMERRARHPEREIDMGAYADGL